MNPDEMFHIGDRVKVGYDGKIKDKVPIGIITLTIELINLVISTKSVAPCNVAAL
ncbi:hypothetical protein ACIQ57_09095 [Lysinibacillus xylanilyticus]|uniref:hypothetical protein n=1 Tax=Lysinibacillus xylanilyticus TaxID=582475 RepID=UPI0037F7DBA8